MFKNISKTFYTFTIDFITYNITIKYCILKSILHYSYKYKFIKSMVLPKNGIQNCININKKYLIHQ